MLHFFHKKSFDKEKNSTFADVYNYKIKTMVRRFIFFFLIFCVNVQAQKYLKAVITQHDGTHINCLAKLPDMSETGIRYKMDDHSKTQKIKSKDVKSVCYYLRGDKTFEIEFIRYISFFEMSYYRQQQVSAAEWIEVLERGDMTLYFTQETSRTGQRKTFIYHYFVKRENEDYATEIAYVRSKNGFLIYRMEAGDYFSDTPGLEKKIENRDEGYTAKDILNIVKEYNTLKKQQML